MEIKGYCVKCRTSRAMKGPVRKGKGWSGKCPKCGTGMFRFGK